MSKSSNTTPDTTSRKKLSSQWGSMRFVLFLALLCGIHVANNHRVESMLKEYDKDQEAIDELRWTYLNEKADFMQESTLMVVSKSVDTIGLQVPNEPLESIKPLSYE